MPTQATIAITPGVGLLLDAVSIVIGANTVIRENTVIADPSNATYLATVTAGGALNVADTAVDGCITANVLAVSLPAGTITTLTPPSAASIAAALLIGTQVAGSSLPVALPTATITSLTPPAAAAIASAIVANPPAITLASTTITGSVAVTGTFFQTTQPVSIAGDVEAVQDTAADFLCTATIASASITALTPPTAAAIAAAIVANPPTTPVSGTIAATQSGTWTVGISAAQTIAVTNAGTFVVQATLAAETTKVIGTVNQGTSPWIISGAVTNAGTFAVQATLAAETTKVIGTVNISAAQTIAITGPTSTTANAPSQVAVGTSSVVALASNASRKECTIVNTGTTVLFLGLAQTPTNTAYHIALSPCATANDGTGGTYTTDIFKGAINAIGSAVSGTCVVVELT
jgi:hypothetical protein